MPRGAQHNFAPGRGRPVAWQESARELARACELTRAYALTLFRGCRTGCGVSAATCKTTFGLATNAPPDDRSCGQRTAGQVSHRRLVRQPRPKRLAIAPRAQRAPLRTVREVRVVKAGCGLLEGAMR